MAEETFAQKLNRESMERIRAECAAEREDCVLVAHDTGDGWALGVETKDGEFVASLRWPWERERVVSTGELKRMGFKIV